MPKKRKSSQPTPPLGFIPLSIWREFAGLVKKHWGDGSLRSLLIGRGGYRPTLISAVCPRLRQRRFNLGESLEDLAAFAADCAERARLADLYDAIQARRGDPRRAARTS